MSVMNHALERPLSAGVHNSPPLCDTYITLPGSAIIPANNRSGSCGSTATLTAQRFASPWFKVSQVAPPSTVLKTPSTVAAYKVPDRCGSVVREEISCPNPVGVQ